MLFYPKAISLFLKGFLYDNGASELQYISQQAELYLGY